MEIGAPVGQKDRITKPDPKKKNERFKPVANRPADVELVQLMLVANGFNIKVDGKCGTGTIAAIKSFQKSALGFNKPDGIVDPGEKTWKKGVGKLLAMNKEDEKAVQDMVVVKEGNKEKAVDRSEFEREEAALKKKVMDKANMMMGQAEVWLDFCKDAEKTLQGTDGFMMAMTEFSVRWVNKKAEPPYDELLDANSEATLLKNLASRGTVDWKKIQAQDKKATAAYNKGVKAFKEFIEARIGTAGSIVGKLETVRDISFTVIETYATAQLMLRKMPPAQAHAMAAGGTEALKSTANQLGEYLAGSKVTWGSAGKAVLLDTALAAAGGAVGGKMSAGFAKNAQHVMALKLAPMFKSPAGKKVVGIVCTKLLDNPAVQGIVTNAAKESFGFFRKSIEKGTVDPKDVQEYVLKSLSGGLMALAPVKNFMAFEAGAPAAAKNLIMTKLGPAVGKRTEAALLKKGIEVTPEMMKKLSDEVYQKIAEDLAGKGAEIMVLAVGEKMTTKEPESGLHKLGEQELRRNAELQKEIETMIEKSLEDMAKKAKGKKK